MLKRITSKYIANENKTLTLNPTPSNIIPELVGHIRISLTKCCY